jgi:hypothetical protein
MAVDLSWYIKKLRASEEDNRGKRARRNKAKEADAVLYLRVYMVECMYPMVAEASYLGHRGCTWAA